MIVRLVCAAAAIIAVGLVLSGVAGPAFRALARRRGKLPPDDEPLIELPGNGLLTLRFTYAPGGEILMEGTRLVVRLDDDAVAGAAWHEEISLPLRAGRHRLRIHYTRHGYAQSGRYDGTFLLLDGADLVLEYDAPIGRGPAILRTPTA